MKSERKFQDIKMDAKTEIKRLKFMLTSSPAVTYASRASGDYGATFISENVTGVVGHQPSDFLDNPSFWADNIHPDDREHILKGLKILFENNCHIHEYRFQHKDGSFRWMRDEMKLIRDASDNPLEIIGSWTDITERIQAGELLQDSNLRYQNLVESTSDWVWEVDKEGRYTYVSPRIKDLLGYEPEEVIHKTPFDLMPPEEAKRVGEIFATAVAQQEPINSLENINLHKDGSSVILETSGLPFFDAGGEFLGYRGIDRDISKRKETENNLLEQTKKLEETNIALRVILRESEITKDELEKNVLSNIKGLLLPYLTELDSRLIDEDHQFLMETIIANINEITSLFTRKLKLEIEDLTPKEIQVAGLIKQGRTNKEIAKLLNISTSGVDHHRRNLRKKFNIKGKKINLRSHLLNM